MYLPNYRNSIVNLTSSIMHSLGVKNTYPRLRIINSEKLKKKTNIILLVLDGIGYEYIKKYGNGGILKSNIKSKLTSVFPSTTASAIPCFFTGFPAQQTAMTGWHTFLKEIGMQSTILPSIPRIGGIQHSFVGVNIKEIYPKDSFFNKVKREVYLITEKNIPKSDFNLRMNGKVKTLTYNGNSLNGLFRQMSKLVKKKDKKYIYAYWPYFDKICHKFGTEDKTTLAHFIEIERKIASFVKSIKDTDTTLIVTADHGLIDVPEDKIIEVNKHPKFKECLVMPLTGEKRLSYAYVKPFKVKDFENYVKNNFKDVCWLHKSQDLVDKKLFGLYKPEPKLLDRIGDYTLIMKDGYAIKDKVINYQDHKITARHGGVSKQEMFVPLIVFDL